MMRFALLVPLVLAGCEDTAPSRNTAGPALEFLMSAPWLCEGGTTLEFGRERLRVAGTEFEMFSFRDSRPHDSRFANSYFMQVRVDDNGSTGCDLLLDREHLRFAVDCASGFGGLSGERTRCRMTAPQR